MPDVLKCEITTFKKIHKTCFSNFRAASIPIWNKLYVNLISDASWPLDMCCCDNVHKLAQTFTRQLAAYKICNGGIYRLASYKLQCCKNVYWLIIRCKNTKAVAGLSCCSHGHVLVNIIIIDIKAYLILYIHMVYIDIYHHGITGISLSWEVIELHHGWIFLHYAIL